MATIENETDCDINVYFVVPAGNQSEDECSADMWHAFNKCCDNELEPMWITEKKCAQLSPSKQDVFVMEKFEGDTFQRLRSFKCPIVGPRCLLICFINAEPIPDGTNPIFTTAMRGLVICASGFSTEEKNNIEQKVEYMGGTFTKGLRYNGTHLITNSVMSEKYEKAVEMKIPIMTEEWVKAVWDVNLKDFVRADDRMFDSYRCPVFRNLVVTATNLPKRIKEEIRVTVDKNGGTFMSALDGSKVTVVLAPKDSALSEKLKYAMQNGILCLRPEWVFESINVGYALPFQNFLIKSTKASSTPEKQYAHETLNISSISCIKSDGQQRNYIDESAVSTANTICGFDQTTAEASSAVYVKIFNRLTLSDAMLAGPFLDSCSIYLAGFTAHHKEKLNKILNVGSATRLDEISGALTHVLIGNPHKASADLKLIKAMGSRPFVLNLSWLEESMKLKRPAPEECFLYENGWSEPAEKFPEPPSPLSKRNLQMLQKAKQPQLVTPLRFEAQEPPRKDHSDPVHLIQQYLQKTVVTDTSMQQILGSRYVASGGIQACEGNDSEQTPVRTSDTSRERISNAVSPTTNSKSGLFEGFKFIVVGFTEDKRGGLLESIASVGGEIVSSTFPGIPDFGVVPVAGTSLKHTVNEIVTNLYIDDCLLQEQVVDVMYYHRPLPIKKNSKPLSTCVITMSMYAGAERQFLSILAMELGARCQDTFARKTNMEKELYASTHLICPTPEGNKYNAAMKWKLPAVTAEWLLECVAQTNFVDETPFLVGETVGTIQRSVPADGVSAEFALPDRISGRSVSSNTKSSTETSKPQNDITPQRHLLQHSKNGGNDSPFTNEGRSFATSGTPKSPFHISTPDTPYGQCFRPNPSPATRKWWAQYIDDIVDIRVEEPPLKRRLPSTPLSELRKQFWSAAKNNVKKIKEDYEKVPLAVNTEADIEKNNEENNSTTSIKRRLNYLDEDSSLSNAQINQQIVQLKEAFEQTSRMSETRLSLSGEKPKRYYVENADHVEKETQPYSVGWEDSLNPSDL